VASPAATSRRLAAPLRVSAAHGRTRVGRLALVALGVAAATAMLLGALGGSLVARDLAVQRALRGLPEAQRSIRISSFGLPPGSTYASTDRKVTAVLRTLTPVAPARVLVYPEIRAGTRLAYLAATSDLGSAVHLVSGRLPRRCLPGRCEVLSIGPAPGRFGFGIVVVGRGSLVSSLPFGSSSRITASGASDEARAIGASHVAPFLVSGDVTGLGRLGPLQSAYRSYSWAAPLDPASVHVWQVNGLLAREARAETALANPTTNFAVAAPDQALTAARDQSAASASRMLLIGGEAAALLLAFAVLAAAGLRRGLRAEWSRLELRGARRGQLWAFALAVSGVTALAGAVAGAAAAIAVTARLADANGLPAWDVLRHSIVTGRGLVLLLAVVVAATAMIAVAVRATAGERRRLGIGPLDVAALAAVGAVLLALDRGAADASTLTAGTGSSTLLLLPVLIAFAAAVAVGRLLGPGLRVAERASRRGRVDVRLAFLALARAPARTAVAAAFLVVSLGVALFASSYRSTLEQSQRDPAAYQVPLDAVVTAGDQLVQPLDAAPLGAYQALAGGVTALPVIRQSAEVPGSGTQRLSPTVLGVPAAGLTSLRWRSDNAADSPATLARKLVAGEPADRALRTTALPGGTAKIRVRAGRRGAPVGLSAAVLERGGRIVRVSLGPVPTQARTLQAALPAAARGGRLVDLRLELRLIGQETGDHPGRGLSTRGLLRLGPVSGTGLQGWTGTGGAVVHPTAGGGADVGYTVSQAQGAALRPSQPTDGRPLPIVASADVAAAAGPGGIVPLDFGTTTLRGRVVAVATRFPTTQDTPSTFVVADEQSLASRLDAGDPGLGRPTEVWLGAHGGAQAGPLLAALSKPPFDALQVTSRQAIEHALASDPLARGIELTLAAAAIVAVALALIGLWVSAVSDLRDEQGELYDLEADGVSPAALRTQLRLRAAVLVAVGLAGGLVLGVILSLGTADLVLLSANGTAPLPPLLRITDWAQVAGGVALVVLLAAAVVELTVRGAFRERLPRRAAGVLE
jgi:hypothetical protein